MTELEKAAEKYADKEAAKKVDPKEWNDYFIQHSFTGEDLYETFKAGAEWLKGNLWKDAQGKDLPEIDREVVALQGLKGGGSRIVFAHRPPASWIGTNILTGEQTVRKPKRYGKGKWNMPDVKWWLDLPMPYEKKD